MWSRGLCRAALTVGSARSGADRPPEFTAGDLDTPLGQALLWLHRNLVMDVSERDTGTGATGAGAAEAEDDTDDALSDRLEREQLARAGTFAMIAATLAHLWLERSRHPDQVELTDDDLNDLWQRWLRLFAGKGDGWLDQLDDAGRALARDRLPYWLPEAVAALCWLVIRPRDGHRERIVAFQPVLAAALAHSLLDPPDMTPSFLSPRTSP